MLFMNSCSMVVIKLVSHVLILPYVVVSPPHHEFNADFNSVLSAGWNTVSLRPCSSDGAAAMPPGIAPAPEAFESELGPDDAARRPTK